MNQENIDELLNGFIDGELGKRERTVVNRLIAKDEQIAQRLQELKKCKTMVSSLPCDEAPAEMIEDIKILLERKTLFAAPQQNNNVDKGVRHLLGRKLMSAAAMFALLAVLAIVIFRIISPASPKKTPSVIAKNQNLPSVKTAAKNDTANQAIFIGRIELRTAVSTEINRNIVDAIKTHGLSDISGPQNQGDEKVYTFSGSQDSVTAMLTDLNRMQRLVNSAKFSFAPQNNSGLMIVDNTNFGQVAEIIKQNDYETQLKAARYFAALNNIVSQPIVAADINQKPDLSLIPKPALTAGTKTTAINDNGNKQVNLTIAVYKESNKK